MATRGRPRKKQKSLEVEQPKKLPPDKDCSYQAFKEGRCTALEMFTRQYAGENGFVTEHKKRCGCDGVWTYYIIRREVEDYYHIKYTEWKVYDLEWGLICKEKAYPSTTQEVWETEEVPVLNEEGEVVGTKVHRKKVEYNVMNMTNIEYNEKRLPHLPAFSFKYNYYNDVK